LNSFTALLLKQPAAMATYELSSTLARYLDKHLCFPLLEFLQDKGVYNEEDIMRAKIALLQGTNMVDFAMDIHKELYQSEDVPAAMTDRRTEVVNRLRSLQKAVDPIIGCLSNPNVIRNFRYVVAGQPALLLLCQASATATGRCHRCYCCMPVHSTAPNACDELALDSAAALALAPRAVATISGLRVGQALMHVLQ
jgi:hypothetical protein